MFESRLTACGLLAFILPGAPAAAQLFGPGDHIIAIDLDAIAQSSYPGAEGPGNTTDQDASTKYLNFGAAGTGLIVTPAFGASVVQSLRLTTANDSAERDPASYDLYGTNDAITSGDNSLGDQENWSLISSGNLALPLDRLTPGSIHDFANGSSYTSYKVIFPTVRDAGTANSMQVADLSLYTAGGGGGSQVLMNADPAIAVTDNFSSESNYPGAEGPDKAIDGTTDKYLNFGKENTGFIVNRADGLATIVESFTLTTANDAPERDPSAWALYGTNDAVTSDDNSTGGDENWTLIDSGALDLPIDRETAGSEIIVSNDTAYTAYRMVFTDLRDSGLANAMQIGEVTFDGVVIPAPSGLACLMIGAFGMSRRRRG